MIERDMEEHETAFLFPSPDRSIFIALIIDML
jgi:hypothetical protein